MAALIAIVPLLQACGGGGSDDDGDGTVRLVNAANGYASLDLYSTDTLLSDDVASDTASDYVTLGSGTYTFKLRRSGSTTVSSSGDRTVLSGTAHTLLAYSTNETLKTVFLTDNEVAPTAGTAKLRIFNASAEAGALDIYVTTPTATLAESSATVAGLGSERISGYNEISEGTYRVRITGNGDKTDLRLDLPSVVLDDQQITTLVLTATPGGVLVHGLTIDQRSDVTARKNPSARVRLVAGAAANGSAAATANGVTLSAGLTSPAVGAYTLVPAGALTLTATLDGNALTTSAATLTAGSDNTLLITSNGAVGAATLFADDNRPALTSTNTKVRLIHGVGNLASPITLTADFSAVATDIATRTASAPASIAASTTMRLEATTPTVTGPLFLVEDVTLQAGKVYTLFMLGDATAPQGVLRRDR